MDCPQCNVEMQELAGDDMVIQRCPECENLWIDVAELNRILLHNNLPGLETMGGKPNPDEPTDQCPLDLVDMIAVEGGPKHSLIFETCEVCGGVWVAPEGTVTSQKEAVREIVGFFKDFRTHAA
jgi:Zn-finger nucleic acid-binding protein